MQVALFRIAFTELGLFDTTQLKLLRTYVLNLLRLTIFHFHPVHFQVIKLQFHVLYLRPQVAFKDG